MQGDLGEAILKRLGEYEEVVLGDTGVCQSIICVPKLHESRDMGEWPIVSKRG